MRFIRWFIALFKRDTVEHAYYECAECNQTLDQRRLNVLEDYYQRTYPKMQQLIAENEILKSKMK
jgi:hypothetical protein